MLATVDQAGKLVTLKTVSLGAGIAENVWYRVSMDVTVDTALVTVVGSLAAHVEPTDPTRQGGPWDSCLRRGAMIAERARLTAAARIT